MLKYHLFVSTYFSLDLACDKMSESDDSVFITQNSFSTAVETAVDWFDNIGESTLNDISADNNMPKDNFAQNSNNSSENATFALGLYSDISDDELISTCEKVESEMQYSQPNHGRFAPPVSDDVVLANSRKR